ncbi:MAG: hypothetical protein SCALA702_24500 [Melioribacteraceae bacterium]|nr:MAG: hypothetical protein SCALA702_24500 [Melioribacteraceae bacterium]
MDLSVIIVNYNVKEFLQNLLDSLKKAFHNLETEVIVIDNASDDGSVEILREKYQWVKLIASEKNLGFGAANNLGLELSKGKYILLINPDTIIREDTLEKMIQFFKSTPDAGMAGCKVLNPDGTLQLPCRRGFPGPWTSFTKVTGLSKLFPKSKLFARYNLTYLDENQTYQVDAISGAFMFLKREVYENIGGFDPEFFMYGEDLDLCYRTQQAGFNVYYVHNTEIIHYQGESTRRSNLDETRIFYDAMHKFVHKHFSSSFIVEWILQFAIFLRKLVAFSNVYRLVILSTIADFVLFNTILYTAEHVYLAERGGFPEYTRPWVYIFPALLQILIFGITGVYKKRSLSVLRATLMLTGGFVFISAFTFFFKQYAFSRAVMLITYSSLLIALPLWRFLAKLIFRIGLDENLKKTKTLVVGTSPKAAELAERLKGNISNIHNVIGLIGLSGKEVGNKVNGFSVVGTLGNISKIISEKSISRVIFASDNLSFQDMFITVARCQGLNVDFSVAGSEHDFLVGKSAITMLEDIPLLKVSYNISALPQRILKRIMDIFISLPTLLLIFPFIYLTAKLSKKRGYLTKFILGIPAVLSGKKSLVGPAEIHADNELYLGKPGLTGFWYTEGVDQSDEKEAGKLNIFYARNQNMWMDFEILGKALGKMIFNPEEK